MHDERDAYKNTLKNALEHQRNIRSRTNTLINELQSELDRLNGVEPFDYLQHLLNVQLPGRVNPGVVNFNGARRQSWQPGETRLGDALERAFSGDGHHLSYLAYYGIRTATNERRTVRIAPSAPAFKSWASQQTPVIDAAFLRNVAQQTGDDRYETVYSPHLKRAAFTRTFHVPGTGESLL